MEKNMSARRGSRDTRFGYLVNIYNQAKADIIDMETASKQVAYAEYVLYESEVEKLGDAFPELNVAEFVEFTKATGAFKIPGRKGTGNGTKKTRLDTAEKAEEIGVLPADVEGYIEAIHALYAAKENVHKFLPDGKTVAISIPKRETKAAGAEGQTE
jgi:hypothetical protein